MIFNMTGGGSNPLNFKVVGGTTEPSNPAENTIWVNTSTGVSKYYFSPNQPVNMASGDVWFVNGTSSPCGFNAIKKHELLVFPLSAKQMVNSSLKDVTAKTYKAGKWCEWVTLVIQNGADNSEITGGWKTVGLAQNENYAKYAPTATNHDDHVDISLNTANNGTWRGGVYVANNKIDLKNVSRITCKYKASGDSNATIGLRIWSNLGTGTIYDNAIAALSFVKDGTTHESTLDVGGLSEGYTMGFTLNASGYTSANIKLYDLYFEA